ncbi:hypothetical protein BRD14_05635 [Halobacteriales archaeon SW_5_68_122]|nr:MAG: hypothetical protein BRD14_05635 [Halobacteriales archaeon SW_5_68_122]
MSAAGRPNEDAPGRTAAAIREAGFVRLVGTADGDALAATGLLARALEATGTPYQASLATVPDPSTADADCTVAVGHAPGGAIDAIVEGTPLSTAAADIVRELDDGAVDPALTLAGATCASAEPSGRPLEAAGLERRPGVALPTEDRIDGLAGSTLVHADFSGDEEAAEAALAGLDDEQGRRLASLVALSVVEDAVPRAAEAVERALRPYECDRFETLGGYADVLTAVARERPGVGVALALGRDVEATALETWRDHGQRAHTALRTADTGRYDGLYAARVGKDAPLGTVARLCFEYRSPEPLALAVTDGRAAVFTETGVDVEGPLRAAATALNGRATARDGRGAATFDGTADEYLVAFREAQ